MDIHLRLISITNDCYRLPVLTTHGQRDWRVPVSYYKPCLNNDLNRKHKEPLVQMSE